MGRDKAFLKINGEALIERQLRLLKGVFRNIIIVANSPQKYADLKSVNPVREQTAFSNGVKMVRDVISGRGPLAGIYSGLLASGSFYNFVVACDMPFINAGLIKYMITLKDGFDIVVPRIGGKYEALFAVYSKNCARPISEAIKKDRLTVRGLFADVRVRELAGDEIMKFGDADTIFMNVNTKKDLCRIRAC
jgi:molybdenum cofactor guanylyltransferase